MYEEPLFDLAIDQVERATATQHNIEGYHGDTHKLNGQRLLIDWLMCFNSDGVDENHVVINLTIDPRLTTSKAWCPVLETLATRGLIQMIMVNKMQYNPSERIVSFRIWADDIIPGPTLGGDASFVSPTAVVGHNNAG